MAAEQSIQMLSFNFGCRAFAYKSLAQGLNRSLSAFISSVPEYHDPVVEADRCAQYVEDIGVAAHMTNKLIQNIQIVFQCIDKTGLKLYLDKCSFDQQRVEFLGTTIIGQGIGTIKKMMTF